MSDRLGFGVVGINPRIRRAILTGITGSRRARLAAVCSRDAAKAAEVAREVGGKPYSTFDSMLEDPEVEAVFICAPHALHAPLSLAALAAGKRVVCEKPLASTLAEAEAMAEAAKTSPFPTVVNFTYHSIAGQRFVAQLLERGDLGRLLHLELSYFQGRDAVPGARRGDALFEIGSHELDLATWWLELGGAGRLISVVAEETHDAPIGLLPEGPPHGRPNFALIGRTERGALVAIQSNRAAAGWRNGMLARLIGERGSLTLEFDTDRAEVRSARFGDGGPEGVFQACPIPPELDVGYAAFPAFHLDRIVAALNREIPFPDFAYGLQVQRLMDAARRSSAERRWIDAGPPPG